MRFIPYIGFGCFVSTAVCTTLSDIPSVGDGPLSDSDGPESPLDKEVMSILSELRTMSASPVSTRKAPGNLRISGKLDSLGQRMDSAVPRSPRMDALKSVLRVCQLDREGVADYGLLEDILRVTAAMTPVEFSPDTEDMRSKLMETISKASRRIGATAGFETREKAELERKHNQFTNQMYACHLLMRSAMEAGAVRTVTQLRQMMADALTLVDTQLASTWVDPAKFAALLEALRALPQIIDSEEGNLTMIRRVFEEQLNKLTTLHEHVAAAKASTVDANHVVEEVIQLYTGSLDSDVDYELADRISQLRRDDRITQWTRETNIDEPVRIIEKGVL